MKIAYHMPSMDSIYAYRTIYWGFRHAFENMGHTFSTFTSDDNLEKFLATNKPDIFITSSHHYYQKFLDLAILKKYRERGMVLLTKVDFWDSPLSRINEAKSMKDDVATIKLIKDGLLGDAFFHVVEQEDKRMAGFKEGTGYDYYTIPLAADKTVMKYDYSEKFASDVAYIGTYLPAKKNFFKEQVFPIGRKYNLKLYGQDWTSLDRTLGMIQRAGQYFNIPILRSIQKPKLLLGDEAKIYSSAKISINVHEDYQKQFGGDCNERTFKVPLCGGFEITDDVACIRKYFEADKEIVIAKDKKEWFEKIDYYLANPKEKEAIVKAGQKKVMSSHTYHNRADQIIEICRKIRKESTK
ncbi:MAG: glycosyltransferase [Candidatus Berkelbacteria bacterium]|nr:glycosyltransferase [Candidatus Berkelbacteria bacterium]